MGQAEVQGVLKKFEDSWLTAADIAEILGAENINLVRRALTAMKKFNEVMRREKLKEARFIVYEYKLRI